MPSSRPNSPVQNISRPSSPRPGSLLKGFRKRVGSAFRKDSKGFTPEPEDSTPEASTSTYHLPLESEQASRPIGESVATPSVEILQPEPPNVVEPTEPDGPAATEAPIEEPAAPETAGGLLVPEPAVADVLSDSPQTVPVEERLGMDIEHLELTPSPEVQFENHIPSRCVHARIYNYNASSCLSVHHPDLPLRKILNAPKRILTAWRRPLPQAIQMIPGDKTRGKRRMAQEWSRVRNLQRHRHHFQSNYHLRASFQ